MAVVLSEQIKFLIELQKIDAEAYLLRKELDEHPAIQKRIETEFEKKKAALKSAEDEAKGTQLKQKQKDGELAEKEEKIKKLQSQLYQLKSNKEYSAMELEIKGLKADKSLLEEEILRLLDTVDESKNRVAKEKELLSQEEKKMKESIDVLKKKSSEISAALALLEEKRKTFTPNADPKIVSQYERVLKKREGVALVPLKGGSCGGCHMELPPQVIHEVKLQEKIVVCESCARILYWLP